MGNRPEQALANSAPAADPGFFRRTLAKSNLIILMAAAVLLGQIPYLGNILSWQMTFFHEISHGLAAILTGGSVLKIELDFSGSGVCHTIGGLRWLISLAGYAGAAFWGTLIYLSAGLIPGRHSRFPAVILITILTISAVFYAVDWPSRIIIFIIAVIYAAAVKLRDKLPLNVFLKLAGLYIILDALRAPMVLFRHQGVNDAANLAGLTGLPAFFWIAIWLLIAAACLALIWRTERRPAVLGQRSANHKLNRSA